MEPYIFDHNCIKCGKFRKCRRYVEYTESSNTVDVYPIAKYICERCDTRVI